MQFNKCIPRLNHVEYLFLAISILLIWIMFAAIYGPLVIVIPMAIAFFCVIIYATKDW